jgi:arylsulfatase A-like enzyme
MNIRLPTLALSAALLAAPAHAATRPNILLIIGDDIGIDATTDMYPGLIDGLVKQYGPQGRNHPDYRMIAGHPASTPVLNGLASKGMVFSQAWAEPYCSPTRASLITGLNPAKTGVLDYTGHLSQNHHAFVRDLKDKGGYSAGVFGKWHMAGLSPAGADPASSYPGMKPLEAGFDLFQGNLNGAVGTYFDWDYHVQDAGTAPGKWRTEKAPVRSLPGVAPTTFTPVVTVADAVDWIRGREAAAPDKPWFAWVAFNLSHIAEKQQPNPMAVPNADTLDEPSRREMQACGGSFGSHNVGTCSSEALMRAMTNSMDTLIGKLLDAVDALDPDTYVIYVGDNGTWMFGPGREFIDNLYITRRGRSKGTGYESGVRVSMVVRGRGIAAGSRSDVPVHTTDLYSTILELAGLKASRTVPDRTGKGSVALDAVSIAPVLFGRAKTLRDPDRGYLLAENVNPLQKNLRQVAARNARYKVICDEQAMATSCVFYDLLEDPLEEYPLAKPASCAGYKVSVRRSADTAWHFCRLLEVVAKESFLARTVAKQ